MSLHSEIYLIDGYNLGETTIGCRICGEKETVINAVEEMRFLKQHRGHLAPIERIMEERGIQCSDIDENELRRKRAA